MQFSMISLLAIAGAVSAASTVTDYSTEVITITSCASTVTNCPATVSTITHTKVKTSAAATGSGTGVYYSATLTGYSGPSYTGAAGQVKAAGALAGVGAVAALLL